MTMEETLAVVQKIADAWAAFGQSIAEAAQALEDMFRDLGNSDELWPKRNGLPPKKYGIALQNGAKRVFTATITPLLSLEIVRTRDGYFKKTALKSNWSAWFRWLSGYLKIEFQPLEPSTCYYYC